MHRASHRKSRGAEGDRLRDCDRNAAALHVRPEWPAPDRDGWQALVAWRELRWSLWNREPQAPGSNHLPPLASPAEEYQMSLRKEFWRRWFAARLGSRATKTAIEARSR